MPSDDFRPTASWDRLRQRGQLLKRTRQFFDDLGFLEVETPLLSHDTVIDRHLDPIAVVAFDDSRTPQEGETLWLQTSPEFGMKRLLAAGGPSIYQITKAFRGGGEKGTLHNPEFTMLEWYGVEHDYAQGMQLLSDLAEHLLQRGPAEQLTYRAAFERYAGVDPLQDSVAALRTAWEHNAPTDPAAEPFDRDLLLDLLLTRAVEPQLGRGRPVILHDYPASQSALAQVRQERDPTGTVLVAERFELYVDGVELANGYHELLDPHVLRARNAVNNQLRRGDGKYVLPEESRLLAAMEAGLPRCAGCALGFDRLAMLVTDSQSIADVIAFPHDRA
jgi:lysyl-tRNA synthetase class 2